MPRRAERTWRRVRSPHATVLEELERTLRAFEARRARDLRAGQVRVGARRAPEPTGDVRLVPIDASV